MFKTNKRLKRLGKPFARGTSSYTSPFHAFYASNALTKYAHFELLLEPAVASALLEVENSDNLAIVLNKKFLLFSKKIKETAAKVGSFFFKKFTSSKHKFVNFSKKKFDVLETNRFHKKINVSRQPILVSKAFLDLEKSPTNAIKQANLVNLFFNKEKSFVKKVPNEQTFLVLKQKRYKRKKIIPQRARFSRNEADLKIEKIKFADRPCFVSTNFLDTLNLEPTKLYRAMKKNKIRHEDMPVQLSRRLLRTKKTLVLPAHVNLTVITNSYDVVHSWFIPALGVKLDCVPGRSTHHVFYCDNTGFYYGQCAEICGRYHHHMPVRLCILPFEHFVI